MPSAAQLTGPSELASAMEQRDLRRLYYLLTMPSAAPAARHLPDPEAVSAEEHFGLDVADLRAAVRHEGIPPAAVEHSQAPAAAPRHPVTAKEFGRLIAVQARASNRALVNDTFALMLDLGLPPSAGVYASVISACGADVEAALELYAEMQARGMKATAAPCTAVLQAHILAGRLDDAFLFYDEQVLAEEAAVEPNTVLFNCMLFGCVRHRDARRGFYVYEYMREQAGCKPDAATYGAVMLLAGLQHEAERAVNYFEEMQVAGVFPTDYTFNHVIKACASRWDYMERAFGYMEQMKACGFAPSQDTYHALLQACSSAGDVPAAQLVISELARYCGDVPRSAHTALLTAISRARSRKTAKTSQELQANINLARTVFEELENTADAASRALSDAEAEGAHPETLRELRQAAADVAVDQRMLIAYVAVYAEAGRTYHAERLFESFGTRGLARSAAAFAVLMKMYVRHGKVDEVFALYARMKQEKVEPDRLTYRCMLDACAKGLRINNALQIIRLMNAKNMEITIKDLRQLVVRIESEKMWPVLAELKELVWHHVPVRRMFIKVAAHPEAKKLPPKPVNPGKVRYRLKQQRADRHNKLQKQVLQKKRAATSKRRQNELLRKLDQ